MYCCYSDGYGGSSDSDGSDGRVMVVVVMIEIVVADPDVMLTLT